MKDVKVIKVQELMTLPKTDLVKEIIRLRKKSNNLIDKLKIELAGNVHLETQGIEIVEKGLEDKKVDIDLALQLVYCLSKELQYPDKWIPFKNVTSNSKEYYRMKQNEFMRIVDDIGGNKKTIQLLIDIGVIKPSQQGAVTIVNSKGRYVRAFVIRKSALHALGEGDEGK